MGHCMSTRLYGSRGKATPPNGPCAEPMLNIGRKFQVSFLSRDPTIQV